MNFWSLNFKPLSVKKMKLPNLKLKKKTNKRASLEWLVTNLDNAVKIIIRIKLYTVPGLFVCNT